MNGCGNSNKEKLVIQEFMKALDQLTDNVSETSTKIQSALPVYSKELSDSISGTTAKANRFLKGLFQERLDQITRDEQDLEDVQIALNELKGNHF